MTKHLPGHLAALGAAPHSPRVETERLAAEDALCLAVAETVSFHDFHPLDKQTEGRVQWK